MSELDRKKVTVAVGGFPGSGKSQVIAVIRRAFEEAGIPIEITGNDGPIPDPDVAEESLKERGTPIEVRECYGSRIAFDAYRWASIGK